jgi:hypothetical protein
MKKLAAILLILLTTASPSYASSRADADFDDLQACALRVIFQMHHKDSIYNFRFKENDPSVFFDEADTIAASCYPLLRDARANR